MRLWQLINSDKADIVSIYFYAILNGLVQLSLPVGVQAIIGFVLGASMVTSIYVLIFLVVSGVFAVGLLQINQMKIIERIQQRIFVRNAIAFAEKIPKFDLLRIDSYYLPEKVNRFFDTVTIQKSISKILLEIPTALIQILFGLILLALYHPLFIVLGFIIVAVFYFVLKLTSARGLSTSLEESTHKYEVVFWLQDMARAVKSFKFSQDSKMELKNTDSRVLKYLAARTEHFSVLLVQYKILVGFKVLITAVLLVLGVYLLLDQKLNIGEFIASEIVILSIISSVEKIIKNLDSAYDLSTGLEKLASVTELTTEEAGNFEIKSNQLSIELVDFNFGFKDAIPLFKNVNAKFAPFTLNCISGSEGSGKTTLLKILSGIYSLYKPGYMINNLPFDSYKLIPLRQKMGVLLKQQDIFTGTILDNISMGRAEVSEEKIMAIAEKIGFENFLQNQAWGFETKIDASGRRLSRSIIQKILLLRALCNEGNYLLLDEPFDGLNATQKAKLELYLISQKQRATIIVASNDPDFASICDQELELSNGGLQILYKK